MLLHNNDVLVTQSDKVRNTIQDLIENQAAVMAELQEEKLKAQNERDEMQKERDEEAAKSHVAHDKAINVEQLRKSSADAKSDAQCQNCEVLKEKNENIDIDNEMLMDELHTLGDNHESLKQKYLSLKQTMKELEDEKVAELDIKTVPKTRSAEVEEKKKALRSAEEVSGEDAVQTETALKEIRGNTESTLRSLEARWERMIDELHNELQMSRNLNARRRAASEKKIREVFSLFDEAREDRDRATEEAGLLAVKYSTLVEAHAGENAARERNSSANDRPHGIETTTAEALTVKYKQNLDQQKELSQQRLMAEKEEREQADLLELYESEIFTKDEAIQAKVTEINRKLANNFERFIENYSNQLAGMERRRADQTQQDPKVARPKQALEDEKERLKLGEEAEAKALTDDNQLREQLRLERESHNLQVANIAREVRSVETAREANGNGIRELGEAIRRLAEERGELETDIETLRSIPRAQTQIEEESGGAILEGIRASRADLSRGGEVDLSGTCRQGNYRRRILMIDVDSPPNSRRHGSPSERTVSLAILRAELGLKRMRESRAARGISQNDVRSAHKAATEAFSMSIDLQDRGLQGRSLFWIGVVEFYDGHSDRAKESFRKAKAVREWKKPEGERKWLGKWLEVVEEGIRTPSLRSQEYRNILTVMPEAY